ncbi:hypothetical protein AB1N83_007306 [Pleurotus pulmonarius]
MESELRWLYTVLVSLSASPVLGSSNLHAYAHYHEDETMIRRPSPMYDNWDVRIKLYPQLHSSSLYQPIRRGPGSNDVTQAILGEGVAWVDGEEPGQYTRLLLETQFAVVAGNPSLELIHGGA